MKKKLFVIFAAMMMAVTFMPAAASATLFNFDYSGLGVTASGTLTADLTSPGTYNITAISGTRNGDAITSFATGGPTSFVYGDAAIDNVLLVPQNPGFLSYTMNSGFVFGTTAGEFNPYYDGNSGKYYEYKLNSGSIPGIEIGFNAAPVPIPAAIWLLGTGLVGLFGVRRRFTS
jgi:hypothetical protein